MGVGRNIIIEDIFLSPGRFSDPSPSWPKRIEQRNVTSSLELPVSVSGCWSRRWFTVCWVLFNLMVIPTLQRKFDLCIPRKRNCVASFPISTFIYRWAIYTLPQSVDLFSCRQTGRPIVITRIYMNVAIRTEAAQFPYWKYFFPIFGPVSL